MKQFKLLICIGLVSFFIGATALQTMAASDPGVNKDTRCAVCGMFVAKYPTWLCKITEKNGQAKYFDGPKDMLAYYFSPNKYGGTTQANIIKIMVKDYYSVQWIDARKAFFVMDSDVHGPMGKEFIPFSSKAAASSFAKDHKAKIILPFSKITSAIVEAARHGQMMMNMKMK